MNNEIIQPTRSGAIDKTSGTPSGFPDFAFEHDGTESNADPTLTLKDPWNLEVEGDHEVKGDFTLGGTFNGDLPSGIPIGSSMAWNDSAVPVGYLKNDGSAVSRTTYSDLFALIGTTYGVGDGSTTFNLPKSDYETNWIANSTWNNATFAINHDLYTKLTNLDIRFFISTDGTEANSFEINQFESNAAAQLGMTYFAVDVDNISIKLGIHGLYYIDSTGASFRIDTEAYYYKVEIVRKDFPKGSIIRATNTSVTLEEVSSDIIADLTVTNSSDLQGTTDVEDLNVSGSHPDLLGTDYTVLADYPTRKYNGTITLSEALTNFEYLVIKGQYYLGSTPLKFMYFPTALITIGDVLTLWHDAIDNYAQWTYTNTTTFTFSLESGSWIRTIYGMGRK